MQRDCTIDGRCLKDVKRLSSLCEAIEQAWRMFMREIVLFIADARICWRIKKFSANYSHLHQLLYSIDLGSLLPIMLICIQIC